MPGHPRKQVVTEDGLDQILYGKNTAVLANTLHFETLSMHEFAGTMLNPAIVLEALVAGELSYQVWVATKKVFDSWQKEKWTYTREERVSRVLDAFLAELANDIFQRVPGPHISFIDPRRHNDTRAIMENAYRLHKLFRLQGIPKENIVISVCAITKKGKHLLTSLLRSHCPVFAQIPATEAGILAAQRLQKNQANVNLYLVSSLLHAAACVETNPATISIPVGNLLHVFERNRDPADDLIAHHGIQAIQSILAYFRLNSIKTKVIGTSFRNLAEIGLLSEFDAVGVSRNQADRLKWSKVPTISLENVDLPVALRGRQAKYPTDLLTQQGGFLASLSLGSRNVINSVLGTALGKMKGEMDAIEHIVSKEVDRQFRIGTLDLKTLYKSTSTPKRKSVRKKSRDSPAEKNPREIEHPSPPEVDPMDEVF